MSDREYRVPVTRSRDWNGISIREIMNLLAPAIDAEDAAAQTRVLDETFVFATWGHRLSAEEGTPEDGELRRLRADIRGLVVGAYRHGKARAYAPGPQRPPDQPHEWVHFTSRSSPRLGKMLLPSATVCGIVVDNFRPSDPDLEFSGLAEDVTCPSCLRWLVDYCVGRIARAEGAVPDGFVVR